MRMISKLVDEAGGIVGHGDVALLHGYCVFMKHERWCGFRGIYWLAGAPDGDLCCDVLK